MVRGGLNVYRYAHKVSNSGCPNMFVEYYHSEIDANRSTKNSSENMQTCHFVMAVSPQS